MIPPILHRVWPGGGTIPYRFEAYWKHWKYLHPSWAPHTWTGEEFELITQRFYDLQDNFGAMSDLLRLEVLYRCGGVYVDTDMEPLGSLDPIAQVMRCFAGATVGGGPSNAIMGCEAGHPAILHLLEEIQRKEPRCLTPAQIPNVTGPDLLLNAWKCLPYVSIIDLSILGCEPDEARDGTLAVHHRTRRWSNRELVAKFKERL
jgi:mannosyltransferase OCH1-like enzyme